MASSNCHASCKRAQGQRSAAGAVHIAVCVDAPPPPCCRPGPPPPLPPPPPPQPPSPSPPPRAGGWQDPIVVPSLPFVSDWIEVSAAGAAGAVAPQQGQRGGASGITLAWLAPCPSSVPIDQLSPPSLRWAAASPHLAGRRRHAAVVPRDPAPFVSPTLQPESFYPSSFPTPCDLERSVGVVFRQGCMLCLWVGGWGWGVGRVPGAATLVSTGQPADRCTAKPLKARVPLA